MNVRKFDDLLDIYSWGIRLWTASLKLLDEEFTLLNVEELVALLLLIKREGNSYLSKKINDGTILKLLKEIQIKID